MNIIKIQSDLMKRRETNDTGSYFYSVSNDYVYYTPDDFVMYRIPKNRFYLDVEKVFKDITPFNVKALWKPDDSKKAYKTTDIKIMTQGKKQYYVVKIKNESDFVWVNERLLKNFDSDCSFYITNSISAVYIEENYELVGMVMPTIINE